MNRIESAPDWKETHLLNKSLILFINKEFKRFLNSINNQYFYWDKIH